MKTSRQHSRSWGADVDSRDRQILTATAAGAVSGALAGAVAGWFDPAAIFWFFVPVLGAVAGATIAGVVARIAPMVWRRLLADHSSTRRWRWWAPPAITACALWAWLLLSSAFITSGQYWAGLGLAVASAAAVTTLPAKWGRTPRG